MVINFVLCQQQCCKPIQDFHEAVMSGENMNMKSIRCKGDGVRAKKLILLLFFFTPIPCTYTSSLLDGMARNCYYYFIYMDSQDHAIYHVWIHFIPTALYPRREKIIWSELESNPGPLASQATALTTRLLLLGHIILLLCF